MANGTLYGADVILRALATRIATNILQTLIMGA